MRVTEGRETERDSTLSFPRTLRGAEALCSAMGAPMEEVAEDVFIIVAGVGVLGGI